ncbi:MAG: CHAT domain-containing protein [Candidatus Nitricoxidivorans perseverans]|uniref:CHAT domain-containing protein n=1 Tax=Candidatus Nitricoxidivorans perseverans TaxID=2975601 RepID=A0AA49IXL8_9PROT|nr:MAG: CHAT domain-containing protein [Candidatus Nitricoxidivorans perseverans]
MIGRRFYHLVFLCLLVSPALAEPPPPRTIDDVTRLLEHYKPDPTVAEKLRAEADAVPPAAVDRDVLFRFYWLRGLAAGKIGRIDQQIADLRKAAEYAEKGTADTVRMLRNLASAETQGGNLLNGVRTAEEGWRQTPQKQKGQMLAAEQLLTRQYSMLGDFEAAKRHLREAEATFTLLRRSPRWDELGLNWTALMERARAEIFSAEGRHVEAEGAHRKSLSNIERHIERNAAGLAGQEERMMFDGALDFREGRERSLAGTLLAQGKLAEAEVYARRALTRSLERVGRASVDAAQGLNLLARIVGEQGRDAESIRLAEASLRSLELAGAAPESMMIAAARRALGWALAAQRKYAEADTVFRKMREGLRNDSDLLKKVGGGDPDWVLAMLRLGRQPEAEGMAKSMLDSTLAKFADQPARIAERRALYAMTLAARRDRSAHREAVAAFAESMPILTDRAAGDAESENGSLRRQRRLVILIEAYLRLLAEIGGAPGFPGIEAADESFRLADIARGSSVQRALTASAARANLGDPKLADLARREQDAQRRIKALSELLTQLLSAPPEQQLPKVQADMRRDIDALREERTALRREVAERFPEYAQLVAPRPAALADARKLLRSGEALVAFYFAEDQGYVWALRADGADGPAIFATIPLGRDGLAQEVAALRRALDPGVADLDAIPPFDVAAAHRLYLKLLKPAEPFWQGASTLLVAPHAALGQLPLSLLPTEAVVQPGPAAVPFAGYKAVPWLLRKTAIVQLPSVTALASLRRLPPGDPSRRAFAGFGDPIFSVKQAQAATTPLSTRAAVRLRSTPRTVTVNSADIALLPRLPDTNDEIREIARVLGADPEEDVFLQSRATEKAVMDTDLSKRRVVMFATHGLVPGDLDGLTQPALALTSPAVAEGAGDGLLAMDEILSLKLDADWVVLSACNTAAGDGAGAEAVSGLGRAFFYAGARALLATNWPVETEAARLLMTGMFRQQKQQAGLSKAEALRRSMLALIDGPGSVNPSTGKADYSHAHPLFWAPFVMVGD